MSTDDKELLTFRGHLAVFRRMVVRISLVAAVFVVAVFCMKDAVWRILLAPTDWQFFTYRCLEQLIHAMGFSSFHFEEYHVDLIATDLSAQFMAHVTTALSLGLLVTSPYIVYELFRFVAPALYANERRYALPLVIVVYLLFAVGLALCYFILFPLTFRFLGTYSVSSTIHSTITLQSYITTFTSMALMMGVVCQLPVVTFVLSKMGILSSQLLGKYRKYSFVIIMLVAAVITPPDVLTLLIVTVPLYLLYEVSVRVARWCERRTKSEE